ncbi:MAG TPA: hypothetical protein PLY93_06730 [Turneriella sp.]|nr:hypothetical protein [Turneriella sp.]
MKRLAQAIWFTAALGAGGSLCAYAEPISSNPSIGQFTKKTDKKKNLGFTAFLKKSARSLGGHFIAAIQTVAKQKTILAKKKQLRVAKKSAFRIVIPPKEVDAPHFIERNSGFFTSATTPADFPLVLLTTPVVDYALRVVISTVVRVEIFYDPLEYSSLKVPFLQGAATQGVQRSEQALGNPQDQSQKERVGCLFRASIVAKIVSPLSKKNNFAIDRLRNATQLAHGKLGAEPQLRRNRFRNDRA